MQRSVDRRQHGDNPVGISARSGRHIVIEESRARVGPSGKRSRIADITEVILRGVVKTLVARHTTVWRGNAVVPDRIAFEVLKVRQRVNGAAVGAESNHRRPGNAAQTVGGHIHVVERVGHKACNRHTGVIGGKQSTQPRSEARDAVLHKPRIVDAGVQP